MLIGNWVINLFMGLFAFTITFFMSFGKNLLTTTFYRGTISFILFFLIGYLFRWLLGIATKEVVLEETVNVNDNQDELTRQDELNIEGENNEFSEDELFKASQYVKELLNEEEV